jgi:hypothetical protein
MSQQRDRDEFIARLAAESIGPTVAHALITAGNRLQRYAELDCSSERAHLDLVPCPASRGARHLSWCLCEGWTGWTWETGERHHGTVPRFRVLEAQVKRSVRQLCTIHGLTPTFQGDPRGYVLRVRVPSGRSRCLDGDGVGVPSQGYTVAQMERITR